MQAPHFDQDLDFLRKMWLAERIGWVLLTMILLAALLGAFGTGLFSAVETVAPNGAYTVSYDRFARIRSPVTLRVRPAHAGRRVVVWISAAYLDRVSVNSILPEPESTTLGADRVLFSFAATAAPGVAIRFELEGGSAGPAAGELGVDEAAAVPIRQFFYP